MALGVGIQRIGRDLGEARDAGRAAEAQDHSEQVKVGLSWNEKALAEGRKEFLL
jgi:hypothetical protein